MKMPHDTVLSTMETNVHGIADSVSVCICTFQRPVLLRNCLASVLSNRIPQLVEVVVVDNDPKAEACSVVREIAACSAVAVKYFHEPVPNIANARNRCVKEANGYWIAFIDDDEEACGSWLTELLAAAALYHSDAVLGPVIFKYPCEAPQAIRRAKKGGRLGVNGYINDQLASGNILIKRGTLLNGVQGFKPNYGLSGSEDTELFSRLLSSGVRFAASEKAFVTEFQDGERMRYSWHFKRAFDTGHAAGRMAISTSKWCAVTGLVVSAALGCGRACLGAIGRIRYPAEAAFVLGCGISRQCGKLLAFVMPPPARYGNKQKGATSSNL